MVVKRVKCLLVAGFSVLALLLSGSAMAQHPGTDPELMRQSEETQFRMGNEQSEKPEGPGHIDAAEVIMEHIMDNHEYHFADIAGHAISIPLPIIIYSAERGLDIFMSSRFDHGKKDYKGYRMDHNHILPVNAAGEIDENIRLVDLSLTRNAVQMIIASILLVLLMTAVARRYRERGNKAPTGFQNAIEPVITFVRDEVAKPNLGPKYTRYLPLLLTLFFFILINNLLGLLPGAANVTGNIAFTMVLALISLIVILFSSNSHFWGHIFWPPGVPLPVKLILIPVELAGVFIKPMALMIRLFANMVAGHIVIICFISLIFIFGAMSRVAGIGFVPVSLAFTIFIYLIEILVAFIQAFIFTNLTAVFVGQAFETGHGHEEHRDPHPTSDNREKEFAL